MEAAHLSSNTTHCKAIKPNFITLKLRHIHSNNEQSSNVNVFLVPVTVCAIAADDHFTDTVWFVQLVGEHVADVAITDDYEHMIGEGQHYVEGHYLEKLDETRNDFKYQIRRKECFFIGSCLSLCSFYKRFQNDPIEKRLCR